MKKLLSLTLALIMLAMAGCTPHVVVPGQPEDTAPAGPTIEETVLVDGAGLKITALRLNTDPEDPYRLVLDLRLENNSGRELDFDLADEGTVNDYQVSNSLWASSIPDGQSAEEEVSFYHYDLEETGIRAENAARLGMIFEIEDSETDQHYLTTPMVYVDTSVGEGWSDTVNKDGLEVYKDDLCTLVIRGQTQCRDRNEELGLGIAIYMENNSDRPMSFNVYPGRLNDRDEFFTTHLTVLPGTKAVETVRSYTAEEIETGQVIRHLQSARFTFEIMFRDTLELYKTVGPIDMTF